ncbi:MAG: hypothetical protein HOW73_30350 [Polyangiaceae bacterium]|nr:hypothetical protein [Polyangiaceae bacterium]
MRSPARIVLAVLGIGAAVASCSSETETEDTNPVTTAVVVDPEQFLGSLPCGTLEGGPRSYIASVTDLDTGEVIGTSERVSCATPLAFTKDVESGNRYSASVQVFEEAPGESAGEPRWTTTCGENGEGAAEARTLQQVVIRGCTAITGPGTATTSIAIDATAAAQTLGCADDPKMPGLVFDIDIIPVEPADTKLPEVTRECGQGPLVYSGSFVEPGVTYTFRLESTDIALEQQFATTCTATALEGFGVTAECGQLTDLGTAVFPIVEITEDAALICGEDLTRARISIPAGPEHLEPTYVDCDEDVTIPGLPAGSYLGRVELLADASAIATYSCTATVDPAAITELVCVAED